MTAPRAPVQRTSPRRTFAAALYDSAAERHFDDVLAFQSHDGSGGFSIWPGHVDFIALGTSGISTLRLLSNTFYVAAPRLLIEFTDGKLTLSGRKIFFEQKLEEIRNQLKTWLQTEQSLRQLRGAQIKQFEQQLTQRLMRLEKE